MPYRLPFLEHAYSEPLRHSGVGRRNSVVSHCLGTTSAPAFLVSRLTMSHIGDRLIPSVAGGRWPVSGGRRPGRPVSGGRCPWAGGRCPVSAGVRWPVSGGRWPVAGGRCTGVRWPASGVRCPVAGAAESRLSDTSTATTTTKTSTTSPTTNVVAWARVPWSSNMNILMVWAWMLWSSDAVKHERCYGLGLNVLVIGRSQT